MSSNFNFSIEILEDNPTIANKILRAFVADFNAEISNKIPIIKQQIRDKTIQFFQATDTYASLISGELAYHFGLPITNRKLMVDNILQKIGDSIEIEFRPLKVVSAKIVNELSIRVLLADFSDILSMSEAIVVTKRGQDLPWLEWLLIRGDKVIISEYEIDLIMGKGRSGGAIMVKNTSAAWRVPPAYAGTINNNWLTRSITYYIDNYLDMIKNVLQKELA